MKSAQEMQSRLKEAVEGRRELLAEQLKHQKKTKSEVLDEEGIELAEEISHLTGVIMTLEWVLEVSAAVEYGR